MDDYVRELQETLHLDDWDIAVDWDTRLAATTSISYTKAPYSRHLRISFGEAFRTLDGETARARVLEALVGCHLAQLRAAAGGILEDVRGRAARAAEDEVGHALDRAAGACVAELAAFLPKPPEMEKHLREVPQAP